MASRIISQEYAQWLAELKEKIRNSKLRAGLKINTEMLSLYWELGKAITEKQEQSTWGDKIISQLALDLTAEFKDIEGFSRSNLFNIRKWYQFYAKNLQIVQQPVGLLPSADQSAINSQIVQQDVGQFPVILGFIPWGHHIQIVTKCITTEEALFYIQQTAAHSWKRSLLLHHIEAQLFHRKGKTQNNFQLVLPPVQSELANELLKNPYNISFLNLSEEASERDLENAILANIKKFLLELGIGFTFYGQQVYLKVGSKDFYIDLLFYHTRLHCYFVIELKVAEFEPEHAGKLEFYITAVDEQMKTPGDNPTIGLLLCKTADKVIVEYSLRTKSKPMSVAEYKHTLPKEWKNELPDEKALKAELEKEIIIPLRPYEEKVQRLQQIVKRIKTDEADLEKDDEIVEKFYNKIAYPLLKLIDKKLEDIKPLFKNFKIEGRYNNQANLTTLDPGLVLELVKDKNIWLFVFEFTFDTFMKGGTNAFNVWQRLEVHLEKHKYIIGPDRGKVWIEKVYRKFLTRKELEDIADRFAEAVIDDVNDRAEKLLGES